MSSNIDPKIVKPTELLELLADLVESTTRIAEAMENLEYDLTHGDIPYER